MKGWAAFFAAVFALAAAVQWNDPDPALWILGYLAMSALSVAAFLERRLFVPNLAAAIIFTLWFATLASSLVGASEEAFTSFRMKAEGHEEPREAVGLGLCVAWAITLTVWSRRGSVKAQP
ncbi:MAG: transmembrane 220 family protein [Myxococcota bacterium]